MSARLGDVAGGAVEIGLLDAGMPLLQTVGPVACFGLDNSALPSPHAVLRPLGVPPMLSASSLAPGEYRSAWRGVEPAERDDVTALWPELSRGVAVCCLRARLSR